MPPHSPPVLMPPLIRGQSVTDLLSQNEYKFATFTFWNYYRFKIFIMQALKWNMTWGITFCLGQQKSVFCVAFPLFSISVYKPVTYTHFVVADQIFMELCIKVCLNDKWCLLNAFTCFRHRMYNEICQVSSDLYVTLYFHSIKSNYISTYLR